MSPYYKSEVFEKVMGRISDMGGKLELKQVENKLKIVARGVPSLAVAFNILNRLS